MNTRLALRLENLIALGVCVALFVIHLDEVRWLPAVVLFVYIDLVGYLPGAIAFHRSKTKDIPKIYYALYNTMHTFSTQFVVAGVWLLVFGWEWALLALPIHLLGDRALFGNVLKPFAAPFEAVPA